MSDFDAVGRVQGSWMAVTRSCSSWITSIHAQLSLSLTYCLSLSHSRIHTRHPLAAFKSNRQFWWFECILRIDSMRIVTVDLNESEAYNRNGHLLSFRNALSTQLWMAVIVIVACSSFFKRIFPNGTTFPAFSIGTDVAICQSRCVNGTKRMQNCRRLLSVRNSFKIIQIGTKSSFHCISDTACERFTSSFRFHWQRHRRHSHIICSTFISHFYWTASNHLINQVSLVITVIIVHYCLLFVVVVIRKDIVIRVSSPIPHRYISYLIAANNKWIYGEMLEDLVRCCCHVEQNADMRI